MEKKEKITLGIFGVGIILLILLAIGWDAVDLKEGSIVFYLVTMLIILGIMLATACCSSVKKVHEYPFHKFVRTILVWSMIAAGVFVTSASMLPTGLGSFWYWIGVIMAGVGTLVGMVFWLQDEREHIQ
jgi:hypothetical protein